jgi:hypothetical protein
MSKIKTLGTQSFNVPNTPEGNQFIRNLRKFSNKDCYFVARGRGSRKAYAESRGSNRVIGTPQSSVPAQFAEWFAVYIRSEKDRPEVYKNLMKDILKREESFYEHHRSQLLVKENEITAKDAEIAVLKKRLADSTKGNNDSYVLSALRIENNDLRSKLANANDTINALNKRLQTEFDGMIQRESQVKTVVSANGKVELERLSLPSPENDVVIRIPKGLKVQLVAI